MHCCNGNLRPLMKVMVVGFGNGHAVSLVDSLFESLNDPTFVLEAATGRDMKLEH